MGNSFMQQEAVTYLSVADAIQELKQANQYALRSQPERVQLPPVWSKVHAREEHRRFTRTAGSPTSSQQLRVPSLVKKPPTGFPSHEESAVSCISNTSSVPIAMQRDMHASKYGLNSMSTHTYGCSPLKPTMTTNLYSD